MLYCSDSYSFKEALMHNGGLGATGTRRELHRRLLIAAIVAAALGLGRSTVPTDLSVLAQGLPPALLSPATHNIDFGYANMDGRGSPEGDGEIPSFQSEVWHYTNLYIADPCGYISEDGCPATTPFQDSLQRATTAAKDIYLILNPDPTILNATLSSFTPQTWARVKYVEVGHEGSARGLSAPQMEARIASAKSAIVTHSLDVGARLFGVTLAIPDIVAGQDGITAASLDFVNAEAYVDAPGSPTSQTNVDTLNESMDDALAGIPATKKVFWWMQAYDRNGDWTNIST